MKRIIFILIALLVSLSIYGQDITGEWNGILKVQGIQLRLVFHISKTDSIYNATMDSPDQNAKGIPVSYTSFENSILTLKIASLGAQYQGTFQADSSIKGTFNQVGQSFPLDLTRDVLQKEALIRPQEPIAPYPYHSEEVRFPSEGGKIELSGTLTLPKKTGRFSTVILVSGSGPQNRDEEFMGHKPFLVLADYLAKKGIAVLRYDDRGFAQSTGDHMSATSKDFAHDVLSAITYLKSRKEVKKNQIGLIGHSEGGLIAPMVAAGSKDVGFMVLLAGPGVPGDQILLRQIELLGKAQGNKEAIVRKEITTSKGAFELIKKFENDASLETRLREFITKAIAEDTNTLIPEGVNIDDFINMQITQLTRPWTTYFLKYDPAISLREVQCPVLAINGGKDVQVAPENLKAIQGALKEGGNKKVTIKEFPNMNHLFQECKTGAISEYATIEQTFAPQVLEEISSWILRQVSE